MLLLSSRLSDVFTCLLRAGWCTHTILDPGDPAEVALGGKALFSSRMLQPSLQGLFHFEVTYILYDFQRKGLRLKLGGVNLFLWEPLLDPLKTVPPPFFSISPRRGHECSFLLVQDFVCVAYCWYFPSLEERLVRGGSSVSICWLSELKAGGQGEWFWGSGLSSSPLSSSSPYMVLSPHGSAFYSTHFCFLIKKQGNLLALGHSNPISSSHLQSCQLCGLQMFFVGTAGFLFPSWNKVVANIFQIKRLYIATDFLLLLKKQSWHHLPASQWDQQAGLEQGCPSLAGIYAHWLSIVPIRPPSLIETAWPPRSWSL